MRICILYDCLYPWSHGGAERWYRVLAAELAEAGHEVTYLTRQQWPDDAAPVIPGVTVVAVAAGGDLYDSNGRRRIGPPLRFGAGVLRHLMANRRRYDVVHLCSFPYFSLIAARLALVGTRTTVGVDWFEVWSRAYWRSYLGPVGGTVGRTVQRLCARLTPFAFAYSELTATRVAALGVREAPVLLTGLYAGSGGATPTTEAGHPPTVVYAGRHIPEKRVDLIPPAVAVARHRIAGLRATIFGDGPERSKVERAVRDAGVGDITALPGFVERALLEDALRSATCLVLPSVREGYGLVVVEAAEFGTPVVVVAAEDNAATELIEPGVNGFVAATARPDDIADAIFAAHVGGTARRVSTARWFRDNAERLSATGSARAILSTYEGRAAGPVLAPAP